MNQVNNIFYVRNCIAKICLYHRRRVPRKAGGIGQWEKSLLITVLLSLFVVVGLICLSSGELEYFLTDCLALDRFKEKDFHMTPEFSCLDISSRFVVALILEHVAVCVVYFILDNIPNTPYSVKREFQRQKAVIRNRVFRSRKQHVAVATAV